MKYLEYIDSEGYSRRSLVRDNDDDPTIGIPANVPDLNNLDWEGIKREINNQLAGQGLYTWKDVQQAQNAIGGIVLAVVRSKIIALYKEESNNGN